MLNKVHHINFLVKDLEAAVGRYQTLFDIQPDATSTLAARGVRTARFKLGDVWLVLVQPTNPDSVPGRHLAEHGEGFFLISFQVDDVESASATLQERGGRLLQKAPRQGLGDWRVIDLDPADTFGAQMQFTESAADKAP